MTGCTSIILAVRLLQVLEDLGIERHLIMSTAAKEVLVAETDYRVHDVEAMATQVYGFTDPTAAVASGGMQTMGMAIVPCSMKTLGGLASGYAENTILRAAEVTMKERRRLVVVARETPLSIIDVENMLRVSRAGAIVLPPVLPFYNRPKQLETIIDHLVGKVLDQFGIEHSLYHRWMGIEEHAKVQGLQLHTVKDVMTHDVLVTTPETPVLEVAKEMASTGRGSAVVVDRGAKKPVAIVTERDFLNRLAAKGLVLQDTRVGDIMSLPLISVSPELPLRSALRLMTEKGVRRLPVMENDKLVGIITASDLERLDPHELL
jgi:4-hydroxy-3-polyprenylbenzoate decarboxylase